MAFLTLIGCRTRKTTIEEQKLVQKERFIRDSVGNSKELVYYRIRDGDSEMIRVTGGKVRISGKSSLSNSLIEAKATLTNTVIQRSKEERRISEAITKAYKTKEVKGMIMKWWWIAVVLLVVWIGWRYKLFRF